MLKVYTVKSYISINGCDWQHVGCNGYTMTDANPTEKVFLDSATFNECYEYVKEYNLDGIWIGYTLFRNRPILYIGNSFYSNHSYRHFDTISYKYVYKEWEDVPLIYIMEHFSADKCIQYLKERGMNTCPILK